MKVAELEGAELDFFVAKAEGYDSDNLSSPEVILIGKWTIQGDNCAYITRQVLSNVSCGTYAVCDVKFSPSSDWSQGGPIIEREHIDLQKTIQYGWMARMAATKEWRKDNSIMMDGQTPLIAAMRAFVASKFGDEVT